jgi:hypothetical protein
MRMTDKDVSTFWNWLKYLWREERSFLVSYLILSVAFGTCFGIFTYFMMLAVQR